VELDETQLADALKHPALHQAIVGAYDGPYSLGVTRTRDHDLALLLRIDDAAWIVPCEIVVHGKVVPIVVQRTFRPPVPLSVNR